MTAPVINPSQTFNSYRKSDAVLIVCQNNQTRTVEIAALNFEATRMCGYTNEEMVGQPLNLLLPKRIADTITEFVEFENEHNDLQAVLSRTNHFAIKTRGGKELQFRLRIIRGEAIGRNPWFHLVLVDEDKLRKANAFREMLKENFKGHEVLDERSGFTNRASLIKDMELVLYSVRNKHLHATFAVAEINQYEALRGRYKTAACDALHRHIGQACKQKLRPEDTVGSLSERTLGLILVDASQEAARMVLNRLRWTISVTPMKWEAEELVAQVNIVFTEIDGKISEVEVVEKCEADIEDLRRKNAFNTIQLAVTHERRESDDRRKKQTAVASERRRKPRRGKSKK